MAARSLLLSALALSCVAALIQVSSGSCLRKTKSPISCSSYAPESYFSKCSCGSPPVEKKIFKVYSGMYNNPTSPCKAHYYNVDEPPQEEEKPCVAHGYGLQVPRPKFEPIKCSSHGYKVETVDPSESSEEKSYAYGYLVTKPKERECKPAHISVGYKVETPDPAPHPVKSNAYGYAVAVPTPSRRNTCVARSFNYQVESPPDPKREDRYAYGIAVQKIREPPPSFPCVDDYEFPDSHLPPPPPKPCVPCEDDYVFPKPQLSLSFREKSYSSSECSCEDGNGSGEDSGRDCEPRYEQGVYLEDGDAAVSDEDDSPFGGSYERVTADGGRAAIGYHRGSNAWEVSAEDSYAGSQVEDGSEERVSFDCADRSLQSHSGTKYGVTSYDTSSYSPYHAFFSKPVGWGDDSIVTKETKCGSSVRSNYGDDESYDEGYSVGESQGYVSEASDSDDSMEEKVVHENKAIHCSLSPASHGEDNDYNGGVESYGFTGGSFNTPVHFFVGKYEESAGHEQRNEEAYNEVSSYVANRVKPSEYEETGSYEQDNKVSLPYNDDYSADDQLDDKISLSYDGDYSTEDQSPSSYESSNFNYVGGYEQKGVDSNAYLYSAPKYSSTYIEQESQDEGNYENVGSVSVTYGDDGTYSSAKFPFSYSGRKYDDSISYNQDGEEEDDSFAQSYSVAEQPSRHYYEKFEEPENYANDVVDISYDDMGSQTPNYQTQDSVEVDSYAGKSSHSPVGCVSCSALRAKYDGGLSYQNVDGDSEDGDDVYTSNYLINSNSGSWGETSRHDSYYPFPVHYPQQEYQSVVGHNLYQEIQTDDHFSRTFAHGGSTLKSSGSSVYALDGGYAELSGDYDNDDAIYYNKNFYDSHERGSGEKQSSKEKSRKVLKEVVVVEDPLSETDREIIVGGKNYDGEEEDVIREEITEYVPEKETKVIVTKVIGSSEKIGRKDSDEYLPEAGDIKKIIVEKIFTSTERTSTEGYPDEALVEVRKYTEEPEDSDSLSVIDGDQVRRALEKVESYEVVREVDGDGDLVANEESAIVKTYGKDSDRVVVVEEESKQKAEVVVEEKPKVVYEKEVLVKEGDGYGNERVVSKEVITKIRPAVAVEVTVSEPHGQKEGTPTYTKYSSEYKPRGSYESAYVVTKEKSTSYETPIVEKVVTKSFKPTSKEVTEVIKEYVGSRERQDSQPVKKVTTVYSGERYEDNSSKARTAQLKKILTEDDDEVVEYTRPGHKVSTVEYITPGTGSKEKVILKKEYIEPKEKTYSVSYEGKTSHSTYHPETKKTVIVTKKTSTEYVTPRYEEVEERRGHEYVGATVKDYIVKKYDGEERDLSENITEYPSTIFEEVSEVDKKDETGKIYVEKTYSSSGPKRNPHSYEPRETVVVTKTTSSEYTSPKHSSIIEPLEKVLVSKKISTEYEEPEYNTEYDVKKTSGEASKTTKVYIRREYENENPETVTHSYKPSGTVVVNKKIITEYERPTYSDLERDGDFGTTEKYVEKQIVFEEPKKTSHSSSREGVSGKESSTTYVTYTKSYDNGPEEPEKVIVTKKVSYPEGNTHVEVSSDEDDDSYVGSIRKSYRPETVKYAPPARHDIRHKYKTSGEISLSSGSRPSHSREYYAESSVESVLPSRSKLHRILYDGAYSPVKSDSSSTEQGDNDDYGAGYIRVPQRTGYWNRQSHSRANSMKSHKSAYRTVHVKSGTGVKYIDGEDDGTGYPSYSSGYSGSEDGQGYGNFYPAPGKASSAASVSSAYAIGGGEEHAEGDLRKEYGNGRVKSFVIREASGNTKKSSGYHRFEHHVSSSGVESDAHSRRSFES